MNLQNIPAAIQYRSAFCSWNPDYKIIGCDYSGMELRILADLSKEPLWIKVFNRHGDLHTEIGETIYGRPLRPKGTNGPEDLGERHGVKKLNFGISYGMGPKRLSREAGMPYDVARKLVKDFWIKFPNIKNFFDEHVEESIKNRCVKSPYDQRLRWFEGFDVDSPQDYSRMRNMCMNFPMQAGNASIVKDALTRIRCHIKGKNAKLILTIHDEILVESHKDCADEIYNIVKTDMINAGQRFIKNVPVEVEGHVSDVWQK